MRIPILFLCIGLIAVVAISLRVRDAFSVRALSLVVLGAIAAVGVYCTRKMGRPVAARSTILVGMTVFLGVGFTNTPLRAAFSIFEPRFNEVSDRLLSGESVDFPTWLGPFWVIDGGVRDGSDTPYFMTGGHRYEINGFVRDPRGASFNLWSITPVNDRWAYIEED